MIKFNFPKQLVFGDNCIENFIGYFTGLHYKRVYIVADLNVNESLGAFYSALSEAGIAYYVNLDIKAEPRVSDFIEILKQAQDFGVDSVIGIGGGSVLDVAKLLAAFYKSSNDIRSFFDNRSIFSRELFLACLPTTAGTGSEVSPNAILLDENDNLKKGIVSPFLVPDATYIDPVLTHTVPPDVTAATGIDALTHCIEAFANKHAHKTTDLYALEGIKLIYENLEEAYKNGRNAQARMKVALGSMYGGLCLGPVNTAAVHALAYPLGGEFHIPHGVSNALLLPFVLEKNLQSGAKRYAEIAWSLGISSTEPYADARKFIENISRLCRKINIPEKLTVFKVPVESVSQLSDSALTVRRLLKNNLHDLSKNEIQDIYYKLF